MMKIKIEGSSYIISHGKVNQVGPYSLHEKIYRTALVVVRSIGKKETGTMSDKEQDQLRKGLLKTNQNPD